MFMLQKTNKKSIFLRLAGGLGNQIFQLGAALLIAEKSDIKNIFIDDSSLDSYKAKRQNNLKDFFDFSLSPVHLKFSHNPITKFRLPKLLALRLKYWPFISDRNFSKALNLTHPPILFLDGYFQECLKQEHFDNINKLLSQMFTLPLLDDYSDQCVIHIRGGDFLRLGWDSVVPIEYYKSAIMYMLEKYCIKKFLVVTDDPKYAIQVMEKSCITHLYKIHTGDIVSDFQIIASVKKRIISNSTFALWASVLGDNEGSVVIAPNLFKPNSIRPFYLKGEIDFSFLIND